MRKWGRQRCPSIGYGGLEWSEGGEGVEGQSKGTGQVHWEGKKVNEGSNF